jgi:hypothetical protein
VKGQSTSYAHVGFPHPSGSRIGTAWNGSLLAVKIATASAGVGRGVAGSIVQLTTVSTMRQNVVMGTCPSSTRADGTSLRLAQDSSGD